MDAATRNFVHRRAGGRCEYWAERVSLICVGFAPRIDHFVGLSSPLALSSLNSMLLYGYGQHRKYQRP
jgi:hypothetical protein